MNSHRYESYLTITASCLASITAVLCYAITLERWILGLCLLCSLYFAWMSEQANEKALIIESEK